MTLPHDMTQPHDMPDPAGVPESGRSHLSNAGHHVSDGGHPPAATGYALRSQADACRADVHWLTQAWARRPPDRGDAGHGFARTYLNALGRYLNTLLKAALMVRFDAIGNDLWTPQSPQLGRVIGRHGAARSFELAPLHASLQGLLMLERQRLTRARTAELLAVYAGVLGRLDATGGTPAHHMLELLGWICERIDAGDALTRVSIEAAPAALPASLRECLSSLGESDDPLISHSGLRRLHEHVAGAARLIYERCNVKEAAQMNWFAELPDLPVAPTSPAPVPNSVPNSAPDSAPVPGRHTPPHMGAS